MVDVLPSTLSYKDRINLKSLDGNSYARLYNTARDEQVWGRLQFDANVRIARSQPLRPTPPGALFCTSPSSLGSTGSLSGYVTNTSPAVYDTRTTFKTGHLKLDGEVPIDTLRPMQMRKWKQAHGTEFFAAARPDTETTSQTMRMFGTYASDFAHTRRAQMFVPHGCPGGPASGSWFHPDVKLTTSVDFSKLSKLV